MTVQRSKAQTETSTLLTVNRQTIIEKTFPGV